MQKDSTKKLKKKTASVLSFRGSAAKAFDDVLRTAARNHRELALSIEGKIVVIDARALRNIIARHHNGNSIESEILQYAHAKP